jgi:hypothetical protein
MRLDIYTYMNILPVAVVAIAHDILVLVVLPLQEQLAHGVHVKGGVVSRRDQLLDVVTLKPDELLVGICTYGNGNVTELEDIK